MDDPGAFDFSGCLDLVRAGDQGAARRLVEALYPTVIRIVRGRLPRRSSEEELAQEVFVKVFTRLDQYEGAVPFPHWVSRIAVTTCIDQLRAQKRRPELRWADLSEEQEEVLRGALSEKGLPDTADALAARELVGMLLEQLAPADRLVLQYLDLEGKTIAEISALTGWNGTLVKVRAFRARRKLRKLFERLKEKEPS